MQYYINICAVFKCIYAIFMDVYGIFIYHFYILYAVHFMCAMLSLLCATLSLYMCYVSSESGYQTENRRLWVVGSGVTQNTVSSCSIVCCYPHSVLQFVNFMRPLTARHRARWPRVMACLAIANERHGSVIRSCTFFRFYS